MQTEIQDFLFHRRTAPPEGNVHETLPMTANKFFFEFFFCFIISL